MTGDEPERRASPADAQAAREPRAHSEADASAPAQPRSMCLLSVPRALEGALIDWILARDDVMTFASSPVDVHGADPAELRGVESVSGRQRRVQFQVPIADTRLDEFVTALGREFRGADVDWFVVPVGGSGSFRSGSD